MVAFRFSRIVGAPPAAVWQALMAHPDAQVWDPDATQPAMARDGRMGTDAPMDAVAPSGRVRLRVVGHAPGRWFETEFSRGAAVGRSRYSVEPVAEGATRLTHQFTLTVSGADWLLTPFVWFGLRRDFARLVRFAADRAPA